MPPIRELRISNPAPHPSPSASSQEEHATQREGVQGANVPPAPQMPRVPGINNQELMAEFARFLEQRRREDRAALEIPMRVEPLGAQKPSVFKGTTSDIVQAVEWICEMADIFKAMDMSEEHKVIYAAQVCKGAAPGKFLGKRYMESKRNTSNKKFKKGFDIYYDKPQCPKCHKRHLGECRMGMGVCYRCGEKGPMAKDCNAPPKDTIGQQGSNRKPAKGAVGQRQRENSRVFAVIAENAERGPNVVAGKIL
ncbi:hypothetical protein NE237_015086 [Protea cynaroides]|uniref:CCHC-type domain-containing protein n=1 Tax=Protea cynaroides TaxID=273540 RepID=A0A9Q0QQQ8_9MAGN|nr:hypothetical protein NE237_015086 [Protea cynaroides]